MERKDAKARESRYKERKLGDVERMQKRDDLQSLLVDVVLVAVFMGLCAAINFKGCQ